MMARSVTKPEPPQSRNGSHGPGSLSRFKAPKLSTKKRLRNSTQGETVLLSRLEAPKLSPKKRMQSSTRSKSYIESAPSPRQTNTTTKPQKNPPNSYRRRRRNRCGQIPRKPDSRGSGGCPRRPRTSLCSRSPRSPTSPLRRRCPAPLRTWSGWYRVPAPRIRRCRRHRRPSPPQRWRR